MFHRILSLVKSPTNGHLESQYREMHRRGAFPGQTWRSHFAELQSVVPNLDQLRIVDYGCGPHGGLQQVLPETVTPYDPFVDKYSAPPWSIPFDVLFSSDVLEHVPVRQIFEFLETVRSCSPRYVFLNVSTRKAYKRLPDGTNAHITVKPAAWWLTTVSKTLGSSYVVILAKEDLLFSTVTLCFEKNSNYVE